MRAMTAVRLIAAKPEISQTARVQLESFNCRRIGLRCQKNLKKRNKLKVNSRFACTGENSIVGTSLCNFQKKMEKKKKEKGKHTS